MTDTDIGIFDARRRSNWIRLRTMILLRWFATAGQLTAILVAENLYNLDMQTGLCILAVGVSVVGNLIAMFIFPENKRLSETENLLIVSLDTVRRDHLPVGGGRPHLQGEPHRHTRTR